MKESGIDWIGQIPEEWESGKVKYFSKISAGATPDRNNLLFWNGDINWMSSGEVNQEIVKYTAETITNLALKNSSTKLLPIGTVMLAMNGQGKTKGTVAILAIETASNQSLASFIVDGNRLNNQYLYYFFKAGYSYIRGLKGEDRDGLNLQLVSNITVPLFDIKEQQKIADFLDKKTAQLDKVKSLLEEQIQKLKDYRASLIYKTVTKGLDKTVPLKDSGIDWIGQVPQGWGVSKLKNLLKIKDGTHDTPSYVDSGIPLITTKNINSFSNYIDFSTAKNISYKDYILINRRSDVEYGDILMPMIGTVGGAVQVTTKNSFSIKNVALFKAGFDLIMSKYLYYQLNSAIVNNQLEFLMSGGVQSFVSISILEQLQIINPSDKDKKKIVRFLDEKTQKIDKLIQIKNQQIENINKQRQTLIYDYVTGKRRV